MKRKFYDSPTTQVVQLEHQARLLDGSSLLNATRGDGYGTANSGVAEGELDNDGNWIWN